MCGRYILTSPATELRAAFNVSPQSLPEHVQFPPRYNIAPSQPIGVVIEEGGARHFRLMRWGLIPAWVKDPRSFTLLINARSETAAAKPSFRDALRYRRCLVPANGYYEWQSIAGRKRSFAILPPGGDLFAFAGLYETWTGAHGEEMDSVAILTIAASPDLASLHDRMPVVIPPHAHERWLNCRDHPASNIKDLLKPSAPGTFSFHEVSNAVSNPSHDDARLIAALPPSSRVQDDEGAQMAAPSTIQAVRKPRKRADDNQGSLF